jgi:uncharacterized protein
MITYLAGEQFSFLCFRKKLHNQRMAGARAIFTTISRGNLITRLICSMIACFFMLNISAQNYVINQAPLVPQKYIELPLGAIKPQGWLLEQLNIMKNGSTGHLDEYYWKLKNDNGWLGGKGDGWEETPYWLDGALPLAYLLDDQTLKDKVLKYINWTLDHQRPSGYFGPITKYERETGKQVEKGEQGDDWWPKMVMLKVLQQYYSATGDQRVISLMTRYFRYQFLNLSEFPLSKNQDWEWAKSRGEDNIMAVYWLYNITKDKFLLDLGDMLYKQTFAWTEWLGNRNWVIDACAQQNWNNWMHRHGVNVAMGLKTPVVYYQSQGDPKYLQAFKTGFSDLMSLHGLPMGIYSADEDLHGNAPTQGTELCAIVETMFSLENAMAITGDNMYMDALERMTFNALPTQTTDDYNMKQYYQMANQVQVSRGMYDFSLHISDLYNVFGARSGYTCCLANMHQGWTKYVSHLWYATPDSGLAALVYGPGKVNARVGHGTPVTINEETTYPFGNSINLSISLSQNTTFPLVLRIPNWCSQASISLNGNKLRSEKGNQMVRIEREWKNNDKLTIEFPMQVITSNWGKNSRTLERGPLVYALKIGEKWEKKNDKNDGEYFELYPTTPWNYGLVRAVVDDPGKNSTVIEKPVKGNFFWNPANAPVEIQVNARKIPGWTATRGVPYQPVTDREGLFKGEVSDKIETVTLIPYGCSKLRIVAFPVVR